MMMVDVIWLWLAEVLELPAAPLLLLGPAELTLWPALALEDAAPLDAVDDGDCTAEDD